MLVRFSSTKTESITMFGNVAVQLIRMLGASGNVPGALSADDIPAALNRLRHELQMAATPTADDVDENETNEQEDREPPIALTTRAGPLLDILERASAAHVPVMWESLEVRPQKS